MTRSGQPAMSRCRMPPPSVCTSCGCPRPSRRQPRRWDGRSRSPAPTAIRRRKRDEGRLPLPPTVAPSHGMGHMPSRRFPMTTQPSPEPAQPTELRLEHEHDLSPLQARVDLSQLTTLTLDVCDELSDL